MGGCQTFWKMWTEILLAGAVVKKVQTVNSSIIFLRGKIFLLIKVGP